METLEELMKELQKDDPWSVPFIEAETAKWAKVIKDAGIATDK